MADGISFKMDITPFTKFLDDRKVKMDRTAKETLRMAGRLTATSAKARAPVLAKDAGGTTIRAYRGRRKAGQSLYTGPPVRGLLRSSIRPGRVSGSLRAYSLKVGPTGARVKLYRRKEEEREGYMAAGYAAMRVGFPALSQAAFDKVWKE